MLDKEASRYVALANEVIGGKIKDQQHLWAVVDKLATTHYVLVQWI